MPQSMWANLDFSAKGAVGIINHHLPYSFRADRMVLIVAVPAIITSEPFSGIGNRHEEWGFIRNLTSARNKVILHCLPAPFGDVANQLCTSLTLVGQIQLLAPFLNVVSPDVG